MRKRLTMALAAGALVAAMVPGVAAASGGPDIETCLAKTDGVAAQARSGHVDLAIHLAQQIGPCVQDSTP